MSLARSALARSLARSLVALAAIAAGAAPALAEGDDEASATIGVGAMSTSGSLGGERSVSLSAAAAWFPDNGHFGGRLLVGLARSTGGTTLVNSERITTTISALGTGRLRVAGPLFAVAGAGPAAVVARSHHQVVSDSRSVWATRPGIAWSAGLEVIVEQLVIRAEHTGAWSDLSRDLIAAVNIGTTF